MELSSQLSARTRGRLAGAVALLVLTPVLAACGSHAATSVTTTSTTTTTLPKPVQVSSGVAAGSLAGFGGILRVPVVPLAKGQDLAPQLPPGVLEPTATVKIGFRQFGSGPDLLLVMGEHGSMTWWDPQLLSMLSSHYRVTLFDLPGVGYSGGANVAPSIESYADVTAGLIVALDLLKPTVAGWGLGGQVALALAERHPGLAERLVLIDTSPGGRASLSPAPAIAALLGSPTVTTEKLSVAFFPPDATQLRTGWIGRIAELPPDDIIASAIETQASVEAAFVRDESVVNGLRSLRVPVLAVTGTSDDVFPTQNTALIVHGVRHGHELSLSGGGYAAISQFPQQFVNAVFAFTG